MTPLNDNVSSIDKQLAEIIAASRTNDIPDVIDVMRRIDGALSNEDGLKWFNFLYLKDTESMWDTPPAFAWRSPDFLNRLAICSHHWVVRFT